MSSFGLFASPQTNFDSRRTDWVSENQHLGQRRTETPHVAQSIERAESGHQSASISVRIWCSSVTDPPCVAMGFSVSIA